MIILLQKLFILVVFLMLAFLLIEGWLSKSVWVKGCENGIFADITNMKSWATKKHLSKEPNEYWGFMIFYALLLLVFTALLLF